MFRGILKAVAYFVVLSVTLNLATISYAATGDDGGVKPLFPYHVYGSDPVAKLINGRVYVYATHDPISSIEGNSKSNMAFRAMYDIRCYSSYVNDLTNWVDHGSILSPLSVTWGENYSGLSQCMWAGDAGIYADGKYYAYFPVGDEIGVFVCDTPSGRYVDVIGEPLIHRGTPGVNPEFNSSSKLVNPHFIMDDGVPYLTCGQGPKGFYLFRLNSDMVSVAETFSVTVPDDYRENGTIMKRGDVYYLTYSNSYTEDSEINWATSSSLKGPYKKQGVLLKHVTPSTTTHNYILYDEGHNEYYLFFHRNASESDKFHRYLSATKMYFDNDGNMITVDPATAPVIGDSNTTITLDGFAEHREAEEYIESSSGISTVSGLKTDWSVVCNNGSWIKFANVDFGKAYPNQINIEYSSAFNELTDGKIEFWLDGMDNTSGTKIAEISVGNTGGWNDWVIKSANVSKATGKHDLYITFSGTGKVSEDGLFHFNWFNFTDNATVLTNDDATAGNPTDSKPTDDKPANNVHSSIPKTGDDNFKLICLLIKTIFFTERIEL